VSVCGVCGVCGVCVCVYQFVSVCVCVCRCVRQHEGNGLLEVRRDTKHNKEERKGGVRPSKSNLCFTVLREVGLALFSLGMTPICLEKRKKEGRKKEKLFYFFFWLLVPRPGIEPITL